MKHRYSFTVLRYCHDVVSEEFVNVGVVVFSPEARFLGGIFSRKYSRASNFFTKIDGPSYRRAITGIETALRDLRDQLFMPLPLSGLPADASACVARVLPIDDSGFRCSPSKGGASADCRIALERIYDRYVERYQSTHETKSRSDDEILPVLQDKLRENKVLKRVAGLSIETPDYTHSFPLAWKNGKWNTCAPVSFDLMSEDSMISKAHRWLGTAATLRQSSINFKLVLFLGTPSDPMMLKTFGRARRILNNIQGEHELFDEADADRLAKQVKRDLEQAEAQSQ